MSMKVVIDGARHSGNYRCVCECGQAWHGQGEPASTAAFSPAMPIAEAVAHVRLCHAGVGIALDLSGQFEDWLEAHWKRRRATGHANRDPAQLWGPGR